MKLSDIVDALSLKVLTKAVDFSEIEVDGGYTSDLLSCVMAGASRQDVWVTLQAHTNIVAVAALLEMSAVIITEDAQPDEVTIKKANEEGVILLSSPHKSFAVVGKLWELGVRGA